MQTVRPPAVAGSFYPAHPFQLRNMVQGLLAEAPLHQGSPKAIVAPHAGYIYSGPIAASVYKTISAMRNRIRRVVLLGPAHRVGFEGLAVSMADAFATPLGTVPLDRESRDEILKLPFVRGLDIAHEQEHSLEVHLPFLMEVLDDFSLVPIVVGQATPEQVRQVLDALWGTAETLIVISSDLSHYHEYAVAKRMDPATSQAIAELRPEAIGHDDACGRLPIAGLLLAAKARGLQAEILDVRSSGDTAGGKDRVVGYGAYAFSEPAGGLSEADKSYLLTLASASIKHGVETGQALTVPLDGLSAVLKAARATFVTLQKHGQLRGCIGSLQATRPLAQDIAANAYAAAFRDPRFPPVDMEELPELDIHLSLLTVPEPMSFSSEQDLLKQIRPGVDGLILEDCWKRGTFLPSVWEQLPDPVSFLRHLKNKAGLAPDYWSETLTVQRYRTEMIP